MSSFMILKQKHGKIPKLLTKFRNGMLMVVLLHPSHHGNTLSLVEAVEISLKEATELPVNTLMIPGSWILIT